MTTTPADRLTALGYLHLLVGDAWTPVAYLDRDEPHSPPRPYVGMRLDRGVTVTVSPAFAARLRDELARVLDAHRLSVEVSS